MLGTSACSQLGLSAVGWEGSPTAYPLPTRGSGAHASHALPAGPGTHGDSQGLAIICKALRLKLLELPKNHIVLPSPEGTARKASERFRSSGFAQRRPVELFPQAAERVRAQPRAELGVLVLHRDALLSEL